MTRLSLDARGLGGIFFAVTALAEMAQLQGGGIVHRSEELKLNVVSIVSTFQSPALHLKRTNPQRILCLPPQERCERGPHVLSVAACVCESFKSTDSRAHSEREPGTALEQHWTIPSLILQVAHIFSHILRFGRVSPTSSK